MKTAEWNILVFLNAKNNLEPFAFPNFNQMSAVGSTDEVNILVEMGRPKKHYDPSYEAWSKTLRFRISQGTYPIPKDAIQDLGDVNMGDPSSLADFVSWADLNYPAKKTALIIWDHGQGWRIPTSTRIQADPITIDRYTKMRQELRLDKGYSELDAFQFNGPLRWVSWDEDTHDKLFNRGIQDALKKLRSSKKLDIIGFDACLMQMVESGYAFRDIAEVMVGSEELEPGNGWDYSNWLKPLIDIKGALDAKQLGNEIVRGMQEAYGDNGNVTLSSIDLNQMMSLADSISNFAKAALPLMERDLKMFKEARHLIPNYGAECGLHSIDLRSYMHYFRDLNTALKNEAQEILDKLHNIILARYASRSRTGISHGLAIYYPHSGEAYSLDPDKDGYDPNNKLYPVEFVQTQLWTTFLQRYWALVPEAELPVPWSRHEAVMH